MRHLRLSAINLPWTVGPLPATLSFQMLEHEYKPHCCALTARLAAVEPNANAQIGTASFVLKFRCETCDSWFDATYIGPTTETTLLSTVLGYHHSQEIVPAHVMVNMFPQLYSFVQALRVTPPMPDELCDVCRVRAEFHDDTKSLKPGVEPHAFVRDFRSDADFMNWLNAYFTDEQWKTETPDNVRRLHRAFCAGRIS